MEEDLNLLRKAELALGGDVRLPRGFVMPYRLSRSTAGPGAGSGSAVFAFGRFRVKKGVSYDSGEFELSEDDGGYRITRGGEPFLDRVEIRPVVYHCPEQAFFNLDQGCMFNCAFCASPRLDRDAAKGLTDEDIVGMVRDAVSKQRVVSVSLTSGVVGSVGETVGRMASCVGSLRRTFPDMPIGVEPYITDIGQILELKEAGADEIKINIESPSRTVFGKVCPELDYDGILGHLEEAAGIFGRGRVSSNIIYGMGETDAETEAAVELLCSKGVIPVLRALRSNSMNDTSLVSAIGPQPKVSPERSLALARMQKGIMERHGLTGSDCRTMCLECTCCDIVPFRDL